MNAFNKAMESVGTEKRTLNEAKTYSSSLSKNLDLFALGGSVRNRIGEETLALFNEAFKENPVLATKISLYIRDVRSGMGERKVGRTFLLELANKNHTSKDQTIFKVIPHLPEIGRWDDLVYLLDNTISYDVKKAVGDLISNQLNKDVKSDTPSLLGKWLPSINAGNASRASALNLLSWIKVDDKSLNLKTYRKTLSSLRKKIDIVETKITSKNFEAIDYSKVPSQALNMYKKTFSCKDKERFSEYINAVKSGDKKMNTGTLYPYQLIKEPLLEYFLGTYSYGRRKIVPDFKFTNADYYNTAWANLPDYTDGKKAIVVADTSGSMSWGDATPLSVAVSLAVYFAERNKGPFKNKFISFSSNPKYQILQGDTLTEKISSFDYSEWQNNTDLIKTFQLVLGTAIDYNVPQEDMPEAIYIVSDMEFDQSTLITGKRGEELTTFEVIEEMYKQAGYFMPKLIFWNVNSFSNTIPVRYNQEGAVLISGKSSTTFSLALNGSTPEEFMLNTFAERYKFVE